MNDLQQEDKEFLIALERWETDLKTDLETIQKLQKMELIGIDYFDTRIIEELHAALALQKSTTNIKAQEYSAQRLYSAAYEEKNWGNPLHSTIYGIHWGYNVLTDLNKLRLKSMYDMNIKLLKRIKTAANSTTEEIHETIDEIENRSYTTIRYNNNALNIMILPKGKDVTLEMWQSTH